MLIEISTSALPFEHPLYSDLNPSQIEVERPEQHFQWLSGNQIKARASAWIESAPNYQQHPCVAIGHFNCENADEGTAFLLALTELFKAQQPGSWIIGPMNGCSWFSYRLTLKTEYQPPFSREPWQEDHIHSAFERAGFGVIEHYCSNIQSGLKIHDTRIQGTRQRMLATGITVSEMQRDQFPQIMPMVYQLCCDSFSQNPFYQPISYQQFNALYAGILNQLPPDFIQLAWHQQQLVGFIFSYPDGDRLIVKTVAVKKGRHYAGLANVLMDELAQQLQPFGFQHVIYALMHRSNVSRNIANRYGDLMREYVMMAVKV